MKKLLKTLVDHWIGVLCAIMVVPFFIYAGDDLPTVAFIFALPIAMAAIYLGYHIFSGGDGGGPDDGQGDDLRTRLELWWLRRTMPGSKKAKK